MENTKLASQESALNPTVKRLGLISFLADISSEMLYPITPIFLTTFLGASVSNVGLIEGIAEAVASLLKITSGMWSDRIQRRKPFVWLGYLFAAVAKPMTGSASVWTQVLIARSLDRFGKGLRTAPRDAMLAESVDISRRGQAFGWHRMMDTLGAAVGPLLAIVFLLYENNLRILYFLAFVPGVCAVFVAAGIRENNVKKITITPAKWERFFTLPSPYRKFLIAWSIFSLTNSSDIFLLLKVKESGINLIETILIYCTYNLFYSLASPYLGFLSDRWGRKKILVGGLFLFAIVYAGFALAVSRSHFWFLFIMYGFYMAATEGVGKAFAIDLLGEEKKATAVGYLGSVSGISTLFASTVAGILWDQIGSASTFCYGVLGAVVSSFLMLGIPVANNIGKNPNISKDKI